MNGASEDPTLPRKAKHLPPRKKSEKDIEAYIEDGAKIGETAEIGPFAYVFSGSKIGRGSIVGSHCIIGHPTKMELQGSDFSGSSTKAAEFRLKDPATVIGEASIIRSGAIIYSHVNIDRELHTGHNVLIREHVNLGKDCVVGTQAILDGYIRMGDKSMVQSQCYITQCVNVGRGVFIAPGCIFMDNKSIVLGEGLVKTTVEDYARIGGGTRVLPGVTIGKYALIGAGSVVTGNVPSKALAYGVPAKVKRFQSDKEIDKYVTSIEGWQ